VAAVAVEPVAKRLGVTKGSFYWHFDSRASLLDAALELWEKRFTTDVIADLARIDDPAQRLRQLFYRVSDAGKGATTHAALASTGEPSVRRTLARVATARLGFLTECYRALGLLEAPARSSALLAYAAYLGTMQISRDAPAELKTERARRDYTAHLIDTLVPGGAPKRDEVSTSKKSAR
jgi:AcrR family transcriptional regulator